MAEKTKKLSAGISGATKQAAPQMQKLSQNAEEIRKKFENLGKGLKLTGSEGYIQKQIDTYSNALERAKLKKEEFVRVLI